MERKRVLVVDDEPESTELLRGYLEREGMLVETCGSVAEAIAALERDAPDLLVLDVSLPDGSGFDILRAAALPSARIPTIMLTGRSEEADRIVGLELGADDYVTKPFSPREVVARVRSLFRRIDASAERAVDRRTNRKTCVGSLEIDHDFREVSVVGRSTNLTATEFKILSLLAENPGEVFTRAHLLDRLGDEGDIFERTLDRHINNLRRKIENDPRNPEYVLTVYGIGYKMSRPRPE
ncbi:MAG TPA: response regulator transcription factor [Candidatus Cybelea sp.]|jgi:DNA-binding response OmpR family regulator